MEQERRRQGETTQRGSTSARADTPAQSCREEESNGPQNLQEPEEDDRVVSKCCDGQIGEDVCDRDAKASPQETQNTQSSTDCLPWCPQLTEELVPPSVSSHPSDTQSRPSDPCWYCLMSLDSEQRPDTSRQEDSDSLSPLPSSGEKVSYQTDPRPHFGVAWSSHSTCRPLWGSEGPCWGQRNQEVPDQTHTCPHCFLGLPPDTLRWHEAKCLLFDELRNSNK